MPLAKGGQIPGKKGAGKPWVTLFSTGTGEG